VIFAVAYIVVEIGLKTPRNLISLGGMAALVTHPCRNKGTEIAPPSAYIINRLHSN
jgi:hypothetical protein